MNRTYILYRGFVPPSLVNLDHQTCLTLAAEASGDLCLSGDIEKWAKTAKHGDIFVINHDKCIAMLDIDYTLMHAFEGTGPGKLWKGLQNE